MFQGVEDTLGWFARTQKTGFRLSKGKDDIAEYFDAEASNESAYQKLKEELTYLYGGTYHIDAKNTQAEPRKILSTDFVILPRGNTAAIIGAIHSPSVSNGYVSREDMDKIIADKIALYTLQEQNERLQNELQNAYVAPPSLSDKIGSLLDHPVVQQMAPLIIAKILGTNAEPQAYQVGIAGTDKKVEPVQKETEETTEVDLLDLTDEQETRLNVAFDSLVGQIGDIEETLTLLECLAPYIQQQSAMFSVIKGELLKYKK